MSFVVVITFSLTFVLPFVVLCPIRPFTRAMSLARLSSSRKRALCQDFHMLSSCHNPKARSSFGADILGFLDCVEWPLP